MAPSLDIYVLSNKQDESTITRFLSAYGHPAADRIRRGEELMLLPLGAEASATHDEYGWLPITTLDEGIQAGLAIPHRAFAL